MNANYRLNVTAECRMLEVNILILNTQLIPINITTHGTDTRI